MPADKKISILDRVRNLMPEVNSLTNTVREELKSLREQIAARKAEREALLEVPMTKDDYLRLMLHSCEVTAEDYAKGVAAKITMAQGPKVKNHYGEVTDAKQNRGVLLRAIHHNAADDWFTANVLMDKDRGEFQRMCWLHLEPIKAALQKAMDSVEWPFLDSQRPLADMLADHKRLSNEIDSLSRDEGELLRIADDNQISVS